MTLILLGEEVLSRLLELFTLVAGVIFKDESWLEEDSSNVVVELAEPVSELRVVLSISVDLVESTDDVVHRLAVGESLEKRSELNGSVRDSGVGLELLGGVGTLVGNVLGVAVVLLKSVKQPGHLI